MYLFTEEKPAIQRNYRKRNSRFLTPVVIIFLCGICAGVMGGIYISKAFPVLVDSILK